MTTRREGADDDDIENHPLVVELRRAVAVQRNALEMQAGTIAAIHSDGDATTRRSDHGPSLRRSVDFFLPLLVGMIIGALGTYATVSGRMAATDAVLASHGAALQANDRRWEKLDERMQGFTDKLTEISEQLKPRTRDR